MARPPADDNPMHCHQCELTRGGCTVAGVCGKSPDVEALQEFIVNGVRGVCAYASEARTLGYSDDDVDAAVEQAMYATLTNVNFDRDRLLDELLDVGDAAIDVMELLDRAHTEELGRPEPTTVPQGDAEGHAILVTGHDMHAVKSLLEATADTPVNVYTHSETLPAHSYPELAAHDHLRGNLGGAWHDQTDLFAEFPGAILGTSNCVQKPSAGYRDRFFTTGVAAVDGVRHVSPDALSPVIDTALTCPPVDWDSDEQVTTGHHWQTMRDRMPEIADAVDSGVISGLLVVAGCDAPTEGREYYRRLVAEAPEDCLVLTTSCGKFRFNDLSLGTVPGTDIPRYVDFGQCNDSISTLRFLSDLASALGCDIDDLPVGVALSWMEQKAFAVLLALLAAGVEDIRLGPTLPEFLTPEVTQLLERRFGLQPIGDVETDLEAMLDVAPV